MRFGKALTRFKASSRVTRSRFGRWIFTCCFCGFIVGLNANLYPFVFFDQKSFAGANAQVAFGFHSHTDLVIAAVALFL